MQQVSRNPLKYLNLLVRGGKTTGSPVFRIDVFYKIICIRIFCHRIRTGNLLLYRVGGCAMSRFVVVSFAFLGWAFYELSGGADFKPPERPEPVAKAEPARTAPVRERVVAASLVKSAPVITQPVKRQFPTPEEQRARQDELARAAAESRRDVLGRGLSGSLELFPTQPEPEGVEVASLANGTAQLVSLTQPTTGAAEPSQIEHGIPEPDMREVTGTRVNMRGGPGTIYPILERLTLGKKVEVLSDSGTGWLRLRSDSDGQVGWVAASLISKKAK